VRIDFALILSVLSLVTGLVWLADRLFFAAKRQRMQKEGEEVPEPVLVDYSRSLFPVFFIVLLLRSFLAEPFRIPSGSMIPTLIEGDFILVNKYAYGLRLPVLNTRILEVGEPQRGDVVVFRYPLDERNDYIKRIVGMPGDTVRVENNRVFINEQPLEYAEAGYDAAGNRLLTERLPGRDHTVRLLPYPSALSNTLPQRVPPGQYLVMGDNRDESADSREWGFVPEENIVGRAFMIWLNCDPVVKLCSRSFDSSRIGDTIE
jgi:signal peptidase I